MGEYTLSSKEYRICILVLLAFKPGEMVNLTGFSSSDISKTRQRLLMKLFGEQGSAGQFDRRLREVGEANAAIFEIHQMMLIVIFLDYMVLMNKMDVLVILK